MLLAGIILLFHHGRPVQLKVTFSLVLPLLLGSLGHMFFCKESYESSIGIVKELWRSGKELASGGVISGALAEGSVAVFSKTASAIIFAALFVALALTTLWPTISKMRKKHQERTRYVEEPEKELAVMPTLPKESAKRKAEEKKQQIDFPLEGELRTAEPAVKKEGRFTGFFRHKDEGQKTPDQVLMERPAVAATPAIPARETPAAVEEVKTPAVQPLDPVGPNEFTRTPYVKPAAPSPMPIQEETVPSAKKENAAAATEAPQKDAAAKKKKRRYYGKRKSASGQTENKRPE
jgi:S-DNA-T family DNA segregation ATPase FtsK/SpoIIIE